MNVANLPMSNFRRFGPWLGLILVLAILPLLPWFGRDDITRWLVGGLMMAGFAMAFDFTAGYINVVNFGFAAFSGAGAYSAALISIHLGIPPIVSALAGACFGALLGAATGVLTLRFQGIYAAIVSWFFGLALLGLAKNLTEITRGVLGLDVPRAFGDASNLPYYYLAAAMVLITFFVLRYLVRSKNGLAFRAIGSNPEAARASGLNPTRYRIMNFTVSCGFAGWFGAFYAQYYGVITPDIMNTARTVEILAIAYLGGRGSLWGPALIAIPMVFLTEWMRSAFTSLPGLDLLIYGLLLVIMVILYPGGLSEGIKHLAHEGRIARALRRRSAG